MPIRWGILGCGDIARKRVAQAIQQDPESVLLAACRRDPQALERFCREFGIDRRYTSAERLLDDPEIDAVYVATPVYLHAGQTIAAAKAGKHVLVEKPMAMTPQECDEMIAACRSAGVALGVAYYRRFYPIYRRMKELVESHAIGTPLAITASTATPFALSPGDDGYWRVELEKGGGGAIMDVGSHRLDLFLDLFGMPNEVKAVTATLAGEYDAEDCAAVCLRFASGPIGTLQCFFRTEVPLDDFAIIGTAGRLRADPLNGATLSIESVDAEREESHPPPANLHGPLIRDFTQAILDGRPPTVTGEDGKRVQEVIAAAYGQ